MKCTRVARLWRVKYILYDTYVVIREAQNCRDKKTLIFFFAFPVLSDEFGKQSFRFRAAKTFFFDITVFLYQDENPMDHMIHGRQFCASLNLGLQNALWCSGAGLDSGRHKIV